MASSSAGISDGVLPIAGAKSQALRRLVKAVETLSQCGDGKTMIYAMDRRWRGEHKCTGENHYRCSLHEL